MRVLLVLIGTFCFVNVCFAKTNIKQFSQLPSYQLLQLSPDGKQLAYIRNLQSPEISLLTTIDLATNKENYILQSDNEQMTINWFQWANNKTLIVSARYAGRRYGTKTTETRLYSIEADGSSKEPKSLIRPTRFKVRGRHFSQFQDNIIDFLPDDPEHVLISLDLDTPAVPSVYKLNIYTRKKTRIERGKRKIRRWMTDQQSNLRLGKAVNYNTGEVTIYVRDNNESKWRTLFEFDGMNGKSISPVGFDINPNILFYTAYKDDKEALYKIDLKTNESSLVYEDPNYDVNGSLIYAPEDGRVIGFAHSESENGRVYLDKDYKNFQEALNQILPTTTNYLTDFSQNGERYVLYAEADSIPGEYMIGDRKAGTLVPYFKQYAGLTNTQPHELVQYTARDGVKIEGYLTRPKGVSKPIATIIHPHGGPGARDNAGFDLWTAYFVNKGYAVFRPNFRGSSGYGYEFAQSQMKGWGLAMQDDITDAAKWLVEQQVAIKDQICIVGASYGGYAAAMAAVKTPDVFKCAVSFAGVMDLRLLVSNSRQYLSKKFVENQIGDDYDDLEARSPYHRAKNINIPILLVHGEDDRVVDAQQSRNMAEELEELNKNFSYIELPNGDHYLSNQRNRHQFFEVLDAFLDKHLPIK